MDFEEQLTKEIIDKRELRGISPDYARSFVKEYLEENPWLEEKFKDSASWKQFTKSIDYKIALKDLRAILREVFGAFFINKYKDIEKNVEKVCKEPTIENHMTLLGMHRSTKERLPYYKKIYENIFKVTGKPDKILDLGCGLNPFSYPFLGCEPEYNCCDVSPMMMDWVRTYFDSSNINGSPFVFDLQKFRKTKFMENLEIDVCFMFKLADTLESVERNLSLSITEKIPAKNVVVSFATKSLGGKKDIYERKWFDAFVEKKEWNYEIYKVPNESFYIIEK